MVMRACVLLFLGVPAFKGTASTSTCYDQACRDLDPGSPGQDATSMLQSQTNKLVDKHMSDEMPISGNEPIGECLCGKGVPFLNGTMTPSWSYSPCTQRELDLWACKPGQPDADKAWLKRLCCDDGNAGSCLCGTWKFLEGKAIKGWGDRTCNVHELSWACANRGGDEKARSHMKRNCCEDPNLGECLCGSAADFLNGKPFGKKTCNANVVHRACKNKKPGLKDRMKKICCKNGAN